MNIIPDSEFTVVFTGSEIIARRLQAVLDEQEIKSIITNDGESARVAGFGSSYDLAVRLSVHKDDAIRAKYIIEQDTQND